jgi:zinc transport system ATP-binding protein
LLLDEPVTGLDPVATGELYELIDHLNHKHGITVIMISHDVSSAVARATHILHLHQSLTFFGKKEAYANCEICNRKGGSHHECCDGSHS